VIGTGEGLAPHTAESKLQTRYARLLVILNPVIEEQLLVRALHILRSSVLVQHVPFKLLLEQY
jgi:hypothetical protein